MRQRLSATLAVLSLLAALVLAVLLFSSFTHVQFYGVPLGRLGLLFRSHHGILYISAFPRADWLPINEPIDWQYSLLGFGVLRQFHHGAAYTLHFPNAFLILLLVMHPLLFFRRTRLFLTPRRERRALGQCPKCSYDLRAHRPGERCPECGTVIPEKTPA